MNRLMHVGFFRLKKSRLFWAAMILLALEGIYMPADAWLEDRNTGLPDLTFFLAAHAIFVPIILSVLIPLFVGTEHSDGVLRNKLIAGCTRREIYLSALAVNLTAALTLTAAFFLCALATGACLLPMPEDFNSLKLLMICLIGPLVMDAAVCALFTLVGMLFSRKSTAAVICILAIFSMLMLAIALETELSQPEYWNDYAMTSEGVVQTGERIYNPYYVSGMKRQVYQFLQDFLPGGQMQGYANFNLRTLWLPPLYSLLILAGSTAAGLAVFRRKNLQ